MTVDILIASRYFYCQLRKSMTRENFFENKIPFLSYVELSN